MSSVIVCGGSIVGLSAAMMLAADGHAVTVLEADPEPVPAGPERAWESWRRKGVAQFHQPNGLLARFRQVCDQELPGLTGRLVAAGRVQDNFRQYGTCSFQCRLGVICQVGSNSTAGARGSPSTS